MYTVLGFLNDKQQRLILPQEKKGGGQMLGVNSSQEVLVNCEFHRPGRRVALGILAARVQNHLSRRLPAYKPAVYLL